MDERERKDIKAAWKRMRDGKINVESKKKKKKRIEIEKG